MRFTMIAIFFAATLAGCEGSSTIVPTMQPPAVTNAPGLPTATVSMPSRTPIVPAATILPTARQPLTDDALPTPRLDGIARERREVHFESAGVTLAGELDLPPGDPAPLAVIIHHSGPVPRDAYGYLAEILLRSGYAVFRFDKRGTGLSGGEYGCCESADALAAYQAAVVQPDIDGCRVFLVAQSIGTTYVAERFEEYTRARRPLGVVLLSNLLRGDQIGVIDAPIQIIVSDSEPDLAAIGPEAAAAHRADQPYGASVYIAEGSEHTLFDTSAGPIDWRDPAWVERYHRGAMEQLVGWLDQRRNAGEECR